MPAEYPSMRDFQRSKRRQVLLLEQGLLNHPARVGLQAAISGGARSAKANKGAGGGGGDDQKRTKLKKLLAELQTGQKDILEASVKAELKEAVNAVADMSFPGAGSGQHWADGWPLNCRLYAVLLGAVFTGGREATIVEEVEDVLGVVGRTWPVLGITPLVHRIVFAWLFLRQYVASGQKQDVMLVAADFQVSWGGQGRGGWIGREECDDSVELQLLNIYMMLDAQLLQNLKSRCNGHENTSERGASIESHHLCKASYSLAPPITMIPFCLPESHSRSS